MPKVQTRQAHGCFGMLVVSLDSRSCDPGTLLKPRRMMSETLSGTQLPFLYHVGLALSMRLMCDPSLIQYGSARALEPPRFSGGLE